MKKLLMLPFLLCLFLTACKDDDDTPEPQPEASIVVVVKKGVKSSSGQVSKEPVQAIIHVWPAEGRDFDVAASGTDLYIGYAYDKNSGEYETAKYGSVGSRMSETIEPGKYFIYVLLKKSSDTGSLAYTYRYFEVAEGEKIILNKNFSYDVPSETYEAWDKNK